MIILSFDPGKSTGWAVLDTQKERLLQRVGTAEGPAELMIQLQNFELDYEEEEIHIVIENYINRPSGAGGFDHNWDKGYTHRIIGRIEGWADIQAWGPCYFSEPSEKPGHYGLVGLKYAKGAKNRHHIDAAVHGFAHIKKLKLAPLDKIINALQGGTK